MALGIATANADDPREEVVVIGVSPNQAGGLPEKMIPYHVQSAGAEEIERSQSLGLSDFLNTNIGSVSLNDAQNNPLQPDIQYRGFTVSPLLGLAQGLAVYQNGIRINEPLGDTVSWDLLPQSAIHAISLIGGANPVFGLNALGGSLSIEMKDGFNAEGHHLSVQVGSLARKVVSAESAGNNGSWGYYTNVQYFDEDGWRDESPSEAINAYASIGWRSQLSSLDLNIQQGNSDLYGNGALPIELVEIDRQTIFTAPDITENDMFAWSAEWSRSFSDEIALSGNAFYRKNDTDSFNGDGSELTACMIGGNDRLLGGLEDDDLEDINLAIDEICTNQFIDTPALVDFLNGTAAGLGSDDEFDLDDLTEELSGTGVIEDAAVNNRSQRSQKSYGTDFQFTFLQDLFTRDNQLIVGFTHFSGDSSFNSILELAGLDPVTRSTQGLGSGTFIDAESTDIKTELETSSLYFSDSVELSANLALTISGRLNNTVLRLADQSGEHPELNGKHEFQRFNKAIGITYQFGQHTNFFVGYSESSRVPTAIELTCNESVFDLALANATAEEAEPNVEFECRLPNAFLADPPLDQVVAKSVEAGIRGDYDDVEYHVGFFRAVNSNDILFQTTGRNTGLFGNADRTRRRGLESTFEGSWGRLDWFLAYSFVEATFQNSFAVLSPNHPFADDDSGEIEVRSGDRIPGTPKHQLKLSGEYYMSDSFSLGLELMSNSNQTVRGDESNRLDAIGGYVLVNLRGRYRMNDHLEVFMKVNNAFDTDYENFGLLGDQPSDLDVPLFANFSNPLFVGPGPPRTAFIGMKLSL